MRLARALAAALLLAAALPASAAAFSGRVSHVTDGDTLWVRPLQGGAPRQVRLTGIDAPEICQAHGTAARDALAALVQGRMVTVRTQGRDVYKRLLGRAGTPHDADLGAWMVAHGQAWSVGWRKSGGPYAAQQARARRARLGLWAGPAPLEPRLFRKRHGSCH